MCILQMNSPHEVCSVSGECKEDRGYYDDLKTAGMFQLLCPARTDSQKGVFLLFSSAAKKSGSYTKSPLKYFHVDALTEPKS